VPAALITDVIKEAEEVLVRESGIRGELRHGVSVKAAYDRYGVF
jgi:regulator of RNase E activity RraA